MPDFTALFIRMVVGLVVVLGLALVLIRVVLPKTRLGRGRLGRGAGSWARVLDAVRLDQHRSLYLVKILERYFVLGTSEHSIQLITELSPQEWEKAVQEDGRSST
jgi:flagellar biogenesis protein FliO